MKKLVLLAALMPILAGCAGSGSPMSNLIYGERRQTTNDVMASWVGEREEKLVASWGPPDNSYTFQSGSKVISYEYIWGVYVGERRQCVQKFMIEGGVVTKWGYSENTCKSPSKPEALPKDTPVPQPTI